MGALLHPGRDGISLPDHKEIAQRRVAAPAFDCGQTSSGVDPAP